MMPIRRELLGSSLRKLVHGNQVKPEPIEASIKRCRYISKCVESDSGDGVNVAQMLAKYEPSRPCLQLLEPLKVLWDRYPTGRPPSVQSDPLRDRCLASLEAEIQTLVAAAAKDGKPSGSS